MSSNDLPGRMLGHYRLERLIGRGGMGEVYEAVDTRMDRTVALKLLPESLSDDAGFRARFLRESQTVAKLNDPHIIPIHDFGELDGRLYLDMRIVHGQDLRAVISRGPLDPTRAVAIITQIADALDTAHNSGMLHRDVKPENILLDTREHAYLADFGLAQSMNQTRLTSTGTAIGSFAYMAPERFGTDQPVGPPSDVYALTCVLYECLTGSQPFASTSIEQIIAGHLSRPVPTTGTPFDPVIAAGMAKNPDDRFATCADLAAAARAALSGATPVVPAAAVRTVSAPTLVPPSASNQPPATQVAPVPSHPVPPYAPEPPRRSRTVLVAAAATIAVLIVAGGVLWAVLPGTSSDSPAVDAAATSSTAAQQPATVTHTVAPDTTTVVAPSTTQRSSRGTGDLGLSTPISTPACNGDTVVFVYNAIDPGSYESDISSALADHPGSSYLRTDQSCQSLKQSENGNPIYAVYYPGASLSDTCAKKASVGGGAYARRLDDSTPVGTEVC